MTLSLMLVNFHRIAVACLILGVYRELYMTNYKLLSDLSDRKWYWVIIRIMGKLLMSQVACDGGVWCGGWGGKGVGGGKWGVWYACVVCRTADGTGLQRDRPAGIAPPSAGERARRKLGGGRGLEEGRREEGTATPRPAGIAPPSAGERARRKLGGGSGRGREEGGGHSDAAARLLGLCQGATLPLPLSGPFFSDGATLQFWTGAEPLALLPLQYYLVVKRTAVISRCLYCRPTPGSIDHDVDLLDVKHQFLCYVESALVDG